MWCEYIATQDITINPILIPYEMHLSTFLIMDSQTDTGCFNKHAFIELVVEGMIFDAVTFDKSIGKISDLPIINSVYTYDNPNKFYTIIIRNNPEIHIKDMKHALMCPNQTRKYGNIIDNITPHLDHTGTCTFTITSGYYNLPMGQYCPTAYNNLRCPSEDKL